MFYVRHSIVAKISILFVLQRLQIRWIHVDPYWFVWLLYSFLSYIPHSQILGETEGSWEAPKRQSPRAWLVGQPRYPGFDASPCVGVYRSAVGVLKTKLKHESYMNASWLWGAHPLSCAHVGSVSEMRLERKLWDALTSFRVMLYKASTWFNFVLNCCCHEGKLLRYTMTKGTENFFLLPLACDISNQDRGWSRYILHRSLKTSDPSSDSLDFPRKSRSTGLSTCCFF